MKSPDSPCYVYVISDGAGFVKIGKAVSVQDRMKELQCANPNKLILLATIMVQNGSKAYALENYLHKILSSCRAEGEWFKADDANKLLKDILVSVPLMNGPFSTNNKKSLPAVKPKAKGTESMRPLLVSATEGARLLSIGEPTFFKLLHSGAIPYIREGRETLVPYDAIEKFVEENCKGNKEIVL